MKRYSNYFIYGILLIAIQLTLTSNVIKDYKWSADPTMRVATISFPSGSVWRDGLEYGVNRWNRMGGMWLEFDLTYSNYSSFRIGDGDNNVAFVSASDIDNNWALHVPRRSGSTLLESDITFNADISWRTGVQNERVRNTSAPCFIQAGVIHEFGHSVGLLHENSELSNMTQGYSGHVWYGGCNQFTHHPTPDDCQGARRLFPYSYTERDASVMNFEMSGSTGTQIWRNNTVVTAVNPGGQVNVEYTVCNPGNTGIDFDLGVYISTNDNITKYDTYIGGFNYYLPSHYAWERDKTFSIPSSMASGTYYIGVVVDIDDNLDEDRECNNNLIFPGQWRVN